MKETILLDDRPRLRLPLYGQVLGWFFVNVGLVSLVLLGVLRWQFGIGFEDLFAGRERERVEARASLVAGELRESERGEWEAILERLGKASGVELTLVADRQGKVWGGELTGDVLDLVKRGEPASGGERRDLERPHLEHVPPDRGGEPRDGFGPGPSRLVFLENRGGRKVAGVEVFLANEYFRHPPRAVLVLQTEPGEAGEVFLDERPLIATVLGLLVLSGLLWLPFVARVTRRLREMTEGTERIAKGDFAVQVASRRGDEIGRLSRAIQRMAGRLGILVDGQKRFLGDTAHELCGPLARMRMGLGVLEQRLEGADRERLHSVEEEVGELARLVDELLDFSKASLGKDHLRKELLLMRELAMEVCEKEALGVEWVVKGGKGVELATNADLLRRALGNVVRNAARYGEGKPIEVVVERHEGEVWLGVLDRGPGLPAGWEERIFEPFARPEQARTREGGGRGLGWRL